MGSSSPLKNIYLAFAFNTLSFSGERTTARPLDRPTEIRSGYECSPDISLPARRAALFEAGKGTASASVSQRERRLLGLPGRDVTAMRVRVAKVFCFGLVVVGRGGGLSSTRPLALSLSLPLFPRLSAREALCLTNELPRLCALLHTWLVVCVCRCTFLFFL